MLFSPYNVNHQTIQHIQTQYINSGKPWVLGYSGGKDSSALLKLVFIALSHLEQRETPITVLYCDTGVEIPIVRDLAITTLQNISIEALRFRIPLNVQVVNPELQERYFVKVIGRGYAPPSNKFRWCTNRLRINPVQKYLMSKSQEESILLLGIRRGESTERDKTIHKHETEDDYYFRHTNRKDSIIYSPIINYSTEQIWNTLLFNSFPKSIDIEHLFSLYKDAGGECPIVRDPKGSACAKGRFGCWTCTVVRKDRAMTALVKEGRDGLLPLLEFRNWLASIRSNPYYRCSRRRNGVIGLGPFTLAARQEILTKLLEAQEKANFNLILNEELIAIYDLWEQDRQSTTYTEL